MAGARKHGGRFDTAVCSSGHQAALNVNDKAAAKERAADRTISSERRLHVHLTAAKQGRRLPVVHVALLQALHGLIDVVDVNLLDLHKGGHSNKSA